MLQSPWSMGFAGDLPNQRISTEGRPHILLSVTFIAAFTYYGRRRRQGEGKAREREREREIDSLTEGERHASSLEEL